MIWRILFIIILALSIVYIYEKDRLLIEVEDRDMGGAYYQNQDIIVIYGKFRENIRQNDLNYLHERCHQVWYIKLNYSEREEYIRIYNTSEYFVSDYAAESEEEDFAESCKVYIYMGELDITRYNFFTKIHDKLELIRLRQP